MTRNEPEFTMGVEEEYLLVEKDSRNLVRDPPPALWEELQSALGEQVGSEFMRSQVEIQTVVCDSIADAGKDLRYLRRTVCDIAERHGLAPIAASTHPFADWDRQLLTLTPAQVVENPNVVPEGPGVYIFRDHSGYLYIGESRNLRTRLVKHLDRSDRQALANYLERQGVEMLTIEVHAFDADSNGARKAVRRAYESELIHSRKPRFNIQP